MKNILVLEEKIYNEIMNLFPLIFTIPKTYHVFLVGGSIKSISLNEKIKDFDFVVLDNNGQADSEIKKFLCKNNLNYKINKLDGYKIDYNNFSIDLWATNDLIKSIHYNADGLFFDIHNKCLLPFGIYDALENGLREINNSKNMDEEAENKRKNKIIKVLEKLKNTLK